MLGVERFFIADNASTDETTAHLAALAARRDRRHLPFPTGPGGAPQLPAYAEILRRHGGEADWIAFLDADEFLLPASALRALRRGARGARPRPEVGAIAVNWALYGSSGRRPPAAGR